MRRVKSVLKAMLASSCLVCFSNGQAFAQAVDEFISTPVQITGTGTGTTINIGATGPAGAPATGSLQIGPGGSVTATGPVVIAPAAGSVGRLIIGTPETTDEGAPGTLTTPSVVFGAGDGWLIFNHNSDSYVFSSPITGGGATSNIELHSGRTILTGDSSGFGGTTRVIGSPGSASGVGTILQVDGILGGLLIVETASWLEGSGTVGTTTSAGSIRPGSPTSMFGTLTIDGDYTGLGGWLEMDTTLLGDGSVTDRLVILGDSIGTTTVFVTNRGGLGALTTDGLMLVRVDGASTGTFNLDGYYTLPGGRPVTIGGAYAYALYQGSVSNPADGNWYLRSLYKDSAGLIDPAAPGVPNGPISPVYQPGVPLYEAYPSILFGMNRLSTLRQRVGNRVWSGTEDPRPYRKGVLSSEPPLDLIDGRGAWLRAVGRGFELTPTSSASDWSASGAGWRLQAGIDKPLMEHDDGSSLIGGIWLHAGMTSADVSAWHGSGKIDATGAGIGASLTYRTQAGFYADAQVQGTWFTSDIWSDTINAMEVDGNNGLGLAASIEVGRRFDIAYQWSVTPQAQLTWSHINFSRFTDFAGADVQLLNGDSLEARAGVSLDYQMTWEADSGDVRRLQAYGLWDVTAGLLDGTSVSVGGTRLESEFDAVWTGLSAGATYNWGHDAYSAYGEVGVSTGVANFGDSYEVNGTAGIRIKF